MKYFLHRHNASATLVALLAALALSACATQKPIVVTFPPQPAAADNPDGVATAQTPAQAPVPGQLPPSAPQAGSPPAAAAAPSPIPVPLPQYNLPDNPPPNDGPRSDKDVQNLVSANNIQFEIQPQQQDYQGGEVNYPYVPNHIYQLFVAPLQLTTVVLEPGETLVAPPAAGDTANFMLASTTSVNNGQETAQILVKAVYAGKSTIISINTSKRSYFFKTISYDKLFMPLVSFNYPLDFADRAKAQAAENANRILLYNRVTDLDFSYDIVWQSPHHPHWAPDRVFTDGKKTYISFPSAARASYAPVLFEVTTHNQRILTPYRVIGTYYVVDRVLQHAELVLDINEGNIVTIVHKEQ